jgi:hypothetical protein
MVISLAVSVCGKLKSLCVCPSLRMHVSIRFWQEHLHLLCFLVLLPVSFPFYGTDALIYMQCYWWERWMPMVHVQLCLHGDRGDRERRCTVRTHQIIGGIGHKHVLVLFTIDISLGCAFLRVQDACVNFCPLFYDRSFRMAF